MARLKHPLTGALYRSLGDGSVEVDSNGRKGVFHHDGTHLSGELRIADPHMLLWLGGPQLCRTGRTGAAIAADAAASSTARHGRER